VSDESVRLRDRGSHRLERDRFRRFGAGDPLSGVANLADLMLVFACGLPVAPSMAWDASDALSADEDAPRDGPERSAAAREEPMQPVDSVQQAADEVRRPPDEAGGRYLDVGRVYRDTVTGRLYVVEGEGGS
jgi:hypothetical protein